MSKFNQDCEYDEQEDDEDFIDEIDVHGIEENKNFYSMDTGHPKLKSKMKALSALFQGPDSDEDEEELGDEVEGLTYANPFSIPYHSLFDQTNCEVSTKANVHAHAEISQEVIEPRFLPHDHEQRLLQDIQREVNVYSDLLSDAQWGASAASQYQGPSTQNQYISSYLSPLSTNVQQSTSGSSTTPFHLRKLSITYGLKDISGIDVDGELNDSLSDTINTPYNNDGLGMYTKLRDEVLQGGIIPFPSTSKTGTGLNLMGNNKFSELFNRSSNAGDKYPQLKPNNISTEEKLRMGHHIENYKNVLNSVMSSTLVSPKEILDTEAMHPKMLNFLKGWRKDLITSEEHFGNKIIEQPIEEMPELISLYSNDSNVENVPGETNDLNGNKSSSPIDISTTINQTFPENTELSNEMSQSQSNLILTPKSDQLIDPMSKNEKKVKFSTSDSSCQTEPVLFSPSPHIEKVETNESKKSKTLLSYEELKREYESSSKKKTRTRSCLKIFHPSRKSSKLKHKKDDSDQDHS